MKSVCLLLFALVFLSCEDKNEVVLPEIDGQFISFKIDGQAQRLASISSEYNYNNFFYVADDGIRNVLEFSRSSSDQETIVALEARDLPVIAREKGFDYDGDGFAPARMTVKNASMAGSLYCPHPTVSAEIVYDVLLRYDRWEDGIIRGSFKGDPTADNVVAVTEGRFELSILRR